MNQPSQSGMIGNGQFSNRLLKLQFIMVLLYFLMIPFNNATVTHYILLAGTFLSMYCIASICIVRELNAKRLFMILMLGITALVSMLFSYRHLRSDLLYSLVCFFFLAAMISINNYEKPRLDFIHFVFWVCLLMAVIVSIYSFLPFAYLRKNGTVAPTLTLNLGNSNYTGVLLLNILCVLWASSYGEKYHWLVLPLTAYLLYLILKTGSRTCILGSIVFAALSVLRSKRPISRWIVLGCLILPIIFVPFYLWLFDHSNYWGVRILGKSLFTGREETFVYYLSYLKKPVQIIVGNFCEAALQNAHNAPLSVLCSLGVVGAVLYYALFIPSVWQNNKNVRHPTAHTAVAALLAVSVASCGESSMFLGGFPGVSFMLLYLWLSNYSGTDNGTEEGDSTCTPVY